MSAIDDAESVLPQLKARYPNIEILPPGVSYQELGDDAEGSESGRRMLIGLGIGILLLFGIMVPAYQSISLGALSVVILPLSAIGAVWGLLAFGTIAGMIPIAMERAIGLERLSPLADASIGGLLVGTLLSLFYLPMFYVWVTNNKG